MFVQIMTQGPKMDPQRGHTVNIGGYRGNLNQFLYVTLGLVPLLTLFILVDYKNIL